MACISDVALNFTREPLRKAFGFKGGYMNELWNIICRIRLSDGMEGFGVGVQSVLWADADFFAAHSPVGSNAMMLSVTEKAVSLLKGMEYTNPVDLQKKIFLQLKSFAVEISGKDDIMDTFILNALVAVDFALWQIWAKENKASGFDDIAKNFAPTMNNHHQKLCSIPLVSYNTEDSEVKQLLDSGICFFKVKIGSNADGKNNQETMCEWDIARVNMLHDVARKYRSEYTDSGRIAFYLDANGRYESIENMNKFIDGVSSFLDDILILEEPFPQNSGINVSSLPLRIAGDESVHSPEDAYHCIKDLGYSAVALKPIAKTLSSTLEIFNVASQYDVPCFCADLTVPPVMLAWNMAVAARLGRIPGFNAGVIETNGGQNYVNWENLLMMAGMPEASWFNSENGVFNLDEFYEKCDLFGISQSYRRLV